MYYRTVKPGEQPVALIETYNGIIESIKFEGGEIPDLHPARWAGMTVDMLIAFLKSKRMLVDVRDSPRSHWSTLL